MRQLSKVVLPVVAAVLFLLPNTASAQTGTIAGQVRDASGGALPGVTVEVTSPSLIEKIRTGTTDENGRYQITALPVGTYEVTFTLQNFATVNRPNILVTSDFTANVPGEMKVGGLKDVVSVVAEAPVVDVQNARQQTVFQGADIRDLPTDRNITSMLNLVPGLATPAGPASAPRAAQAGSASSAVPAFRTSTRTPRCSMSAIRRDSARAASWSTAW